jgi:hypothetical protein
VQRSKLSRIPALKRVPSVVVTASTVGRGIVTAISWLGTKVRAFAPAHLDDGFDYLGLPPGLRPAVLREVAALRMGLVGDTLDSFETGSPALPDGRLPVDFVIEEGLARIRERVASR